MFLRIGSEFASGPVMTFIRLFIGGLMLIVIYEYRSRKSLNNKIFELRNLKKFIIIGLINSAIPFTLFAIAVKSLETSIISILNGLSVLFTFVLSAIFLKEKLTIRAIFGFICGIFGVFVIYAKSLNSLDYSQIAAILLIVLATFCYGVAAVYTKAKIKGIDPLATASASVLLGSVALFPMFVIQADFNSFINLKFIFAMLALGVCCTGIAYLCYFRLIQNVGANFAIMTAFLIPIFGTINGVIFLGEHLNFEKIIGGMIILFGMWCIIIKPKNVDSKSDKNDILRNFYVKHNTKSSF